MTQPSLVQRRISRNVRRLLFEAEATQRELARHLGITPSQLSRCLTRTGKQTRSWTVEDVAGIATFFGVDTNTVMDGDG